MLDARCQKWIKASSIGINENGRLISARKFLHLKVRTAGFDQRQTQITRG
jgi:hypothetical protein